MNINYEIERLVQHGIRRGLIHKLDKVEVTNKVIEVLNLDDFNISDAEIERIVSEDRGLVLPSEILNNILNYAAKNNKLGVLEEAGVTYRDLLDSKIMGVLTPSTSTLVREFERRKKVSLKNATDYYYGMSQATNYIRMDRIAKNMHWYSETEYGGLEITINLSKPEKDPKAIAAAINVAANTYPKCLLCKENSGYRGRINHPGRQNHRVLPLELQGKEWYLQYSPYVYYNEHSIIFSGKHEAMSINRDTFDKLLEFTEEFPHYFCGSNADLPIVGGSILSHDHFQGGRHEFPMETAPVEKKILFKGWEDVEAGIVKWPMSVIRINHSDRKRLVELGDKILNEWKAYSDHLAELHSHTGAEPHNTITPIARRRGEKYELDLVFRNNRTTREHPMGLFHPHEEVHHIKKENIGLIEVMGLAVLPGRLREELAILEDYLTGEEWQIRVQTDERVAKHLQWCNEIVERVDLTPENITLILQEEVGKKFSIVLEHAGVFKRSALGQQAFERFIDALNI